ncbi:MAG TPA: ATP-binding protein [Candidatus Elarobacter sp.]|jgi:anti-sigma regulatory factor (Ser/Thr protein kinase)
MTVGAERQSEWSMVVPDAREALRARIAVRHFLAEQADASSDLDAVEIIVGELVANVIQYAPGAMGIHVAWDGTTASLVISDRGQGLPAVRPVPDAADTRGRGLFLVQALALAMQVDSTAGYGTRVLVELPVRRRRRLYGPS